MLHEEDFIPESTDFATMTDEAFFFNCFKMNYGMEVVDRFKQLGPWEHIMIGIIARRPALGQLVDLLEPIVLINCDLAVPYIQVPPEVWVHAFSDSNAVTELADGEYRSMRTRVTVPKIVFTSQKNGYVLKVIPSFLLLLAQERVTLPSHQPMINDRSQVPDLTLPQSEDLINVWREILPLQREITRLLHGHPTLDIASVTLEIPTERINVLVSYITKIEDKMHPAQPLFMTYVEESWLLHLSQPGENVALGGAIAGQQFAWECTFLRCRRLSTGVLYFDDENLRHLAAGWADPDNHRIKRTLIVGDKYYLNTKWPEWAYYPEVKWEGILPSVRGVENLPLLKAPLQVAPKTAFRQLATEGAPDEALSLGIPGISQFLAFCQGILQTQVALVDRRQGLLLFQDNSDQYKHYLLKLAGPPYSVRGYIGGILEYLDLFIEGTNTLRAFSLQEDQGIVELNVGLLASFLRSVAYTNLEPLVSVALRLRNDDALNINLIFGDPFSPRSTQGGGTSTLDGIVSAWDYLPERGTFELSLSPDRLDTVRGILQDAAAPQVPPDPLEWFALEEELMEKHPDLHAQIVEEYIEKHGDPADKEEEPSSELEREALYWEEEANKSTAVPTRVVKREGDRIYTETIGDRIKYTELEESDEDYQGPDEDIDESEDLEDKEEDDHEYEEEKD